MRAIWEGSISFGLINIPVRLYTAVREKRLSFNYLRKNDLCQIQYVKVCKKTGEEVPYDDIVKGYEYQKGSYVVMEEKDFEKADVRKTHSIEVFQFSRESEVDCMLFEKPYYLEPKKEAQKAYVLFREALKKSAKVGIAKFVLRSREKLAVIRPMGNLILLDQIRFAEEVVKPDDLYIPENENVQKNELDIAIKLVDQLTEKFELEKYKDTYTAELQRIINAKAKGKIPKAKGEIPVPVTEMEDIIEKLKESLEYAHKKK